MTRLSTLTPPPHHRTCLAPTQSIGLPEFLTPNEQIQGAFTAMSGSDAHTYTHEHARGLQHDNNPVLPTADEAVPQMSFLSHSGLFSQSNL